MIFTIGGDFALSASRGEPHNWMVREQENLVSLKKQLYNALCRKVGIMIEKPYRNYPFKEINLPEYSSNYKEPFSYPIPEDCLKNIKELFEVDGLNFINLESPFTEIGRHIGDHKSNPKYLDLLKKHHISLVSVANNHIFDQGEAGFIDTITNLDKYNLSFIGGGYTLEEAVKPIIIEKEGQSFAFFAFCDHCNSGYISLARNNAPGMLPLCYDLMESCINSIREKVDFICVYLHYGLENTSFIHPIEKKVAHWLVDHGTDIVIGGHSHVPKGVELYKGKPILYSQGNLVFDYCLTPWGNNTISQLEISNKKIHSIKVYEIEGEGDKIVCPQLVDDMCHTKRLDDIYQVSKGMGVKFKKKKNYLECMFE